MKSNLPTEQIISWLTSHGFTPSRVLRKPDELAIDCPKCGKPDHFHFNPYKEIGGCWSCSYKPDFYQVIADIERVDRKQVELHIEAFTGGDDMETVIAMLSNEPAERPEPTHVNADLPAEYERVVDPLRSQIKIPIYLKSRNYPVEILNQYRIGFCLTGDYAARIIFPVSCSGMRSFVARRIFDYMAAKYKNPPGALHSKLLYGYDELTFRQKRILFICEGPTDVLRLAQYGYSAVATFGKKISYDQINLLQLLRPDEVIIMFDADALTENEKSFERLSHFMPTSIIALPQKPNGEYYDPDDIERRDLDILYSRRSGVNDLDETIRILTRRN